MRQIKRTLGNRTLRWLLISQAPADFADWLDFVAIGVLLSFVWNAEPVAFAFLAVCLGLPYLAVGPPTGVLVDRMNIKTVLMAANLGRAAATACLVFAPNWQVLVLIVFLRSSVDAFYVPAKQAAIQAIVAPNLLMSANGVSHAVNQASKIVAPALGGTLLLIFAPQSVFMVNAAISVLAAGLLLGLPHIDRAEIKATQHESMFAEIRAGLDEVRNSVPLRGALLVMAAGYFAMFFYDTFIAPLTKALHFDETTLGLALSAVGAGGVAGSTWLAMKSDMRRPFAWVGVGSFISGIAVAILGTTEMLDKPMVWALFIGLFAVIGFSSALAVVPVRTIIQRETPPDKIARVTALSEAANTTALLAAPFAGSALASVSSIGAAFVAGGSMLVLTAIVAMRLHRRSTFKAN